MGCINIGDCFTIQQDYFHKKALFSIFLFKNVLCLLCYTIEAIGWTSSICLLSNSFNLWLNYHCLANISVTCNFEISTNIQQQNIPTSQWITFVVSDMGCWLSALLSALHGSLVAKQKNRIFVIVWHSWLTVKQNVWYICSFLLAKYMYKIFIKRG